MRYETPTPSPLAGAESLLADGAFAASFGGLGNWLLPLLLACHLQAGTRFHGIGQRQRTVGWKSLLGRLANGSGQGWHTCWEHPGGQGSSPHQVVAARRDESGRTALLTASRVKMGQVGAHGNYGETLFLCRFDPVVPLDRGSVVKISGRASWLACSRQCRPGFADLFIEIPVAEKIEYDPFWRPKFESFRQTLPGDPPAEWSFRAVRKSDKVDLFLPPSFPAEAGGIYFFPFGRQIRSHAPQLFRKDRSGWILSLKRSAWSSGQERELSGLLHRKEGWGIANTRNYLRLRATFSEE